jgi:hypothetical protein
MTKKMKQIRVLSVPVLLLAMTLSASAQTATTVQVSDMPGQNFGEKLKACIAKLGAQGGVCDATKISGPQTSQVDPFTAATGPVRVHLGSATITTSKGWAMTDNSVLAGIDTNQAKLVLADGAKGDLIANAAGAKGNHHIVLHNLTLDGNGSRQTKPVSTVHFRKVSQFELVRVTVLNSATHGIALDDGCEHGEIRQSTIENVLVGSGIRAGNTPMEGAVSFVRLLDNNIRQVKADGIFVLGATASANSHDITIQGNTISGVHDTSIEIGDGARTVRVANNTVVLKGAPGGSAGSTGISARSSQNVQIVSNTVTGDPAQKQQVGLLVWSPATDKGGPLKDVTLETNTLTDVAGEGIKIHSGDSIKMVRNTVRHSAVKGLEITTKATHVTQDGNVLE